LTVFATFPGRVRQVRSQSPSASTALRKSLLATAFRTRKSPACARVGNPNIAESSKTGSHVTFVGHVNDDGTFTGVGGNQGGTRQYRANEFEFRRPPDTGIPEGDGVPHPGGQPPGTAPSTAPKPVTRESVLPKESLLRGFGRALLVGAYGPGAATTYEQVQQARMGVMQSNYDLQERENMINYQNNSARQNGSILADLAHAPGSAPSPAGAAAGVSGRALPETEARTPHKSQPAARQ
jgi:hypothetical protein